MRLLLSIVLASLFAIPITANARQAPLKFDAKRPVKVRITTIRHYADIEQTKLLNEFNAYEIPRRKRLQGLREEAIESLKNNGVILVEKGQDYDLEVNLVIISELLSTERDTQLFISVRAVKNNRVRVFHVAKKFSITIIFNSTAIHQLVKDSSHEVAEALKDNIYEYEKTRP